MREELNQNSIFETQHLERQINYGTSIRISRKERMAKSALEALPREEDKVSIQPQKFTPDYLDRTLNYV